MFLLLNVLIFLLKSGIEPILQNSSRKQKTSVSHFPAGVESAYLTSLIKRNVKNNDAKKSLLESTSLVII